MKALILNDFNTPYQSKDIEKPVAGRGEVLVKIMASAVNPLDLKIVAGQAAHAKAKLPAILGIDMAGIVEAVGDGVSRFNPGDEVYGMTGGINGIAGSLAEFAAVDADLLAIKPKNLSFREAAAVPLIFITAWEGLIDRANVHQGQTVLIHGGAGGIGHIAIQIAIAKGAKVFSTVKPAQADLIIRYGATPIDHTTISVEDYIREYTGGEGFDVIFDTVGGSTLDDSFKAVKQYTGHVLSALGWGNHSLAPLSFHGATYSGVFTLYPLISGKGRLHHGEILSDATTLIEASKVFPLVDKTKYSLETIEKAYQAQAQKTANGKVVVNIG